MLGRDGGLVERLQVVLKDVPDKALKCILDGFSKVLLRVFLVVSLTILAAVSLATCSCSDFPGGVRGCECVRGGCF